MLRYDSIVVAADRWVEELRDAGGDRLATAVALAKEGTAFQATALGVTLRWSTWPVHSPPSAAALDIAARYGVVADADQQVAIRSLDRLPEPVRGRLTGIFDAFLGFAE